MDWLNSRRNRALNTVDSTTTPRRPSGLPPQQNSTPAATHAAPGTASPFCRLPPEIRNAVYTHLFTSATPLIKPAYTVPALLLTNRQIHTEAIGLYYTLSTFRCLDEDSTIKWLVNLRPETRELLTEVKYDTRWIIFKTPFIPVPGAEAWLWEILRARLRERGLVVGKGKGVEEWKFFRAFGRGVMKVSVWQRRKDGQGGEVVWVDVEDLEEEVDGVDDE